MCRICRSHLRVLATPRCARCGAPTAWPVERCRECAGRRLAFASARAAVAYAGPARPLVHAWKERGLRRAAVLAGNLVVAHVERPQADVIVPIPADAARQLRRGDHPAERLARELARHWSLEEAALLARTRHGSRQTGFRQTGLGRAERRANVRGAFVATGSVQPTVILVDDVYTTGATAGAAAAALRLGGASLVHVVSFARTVR
jgi:ComF family protein